MNEVFQLSLVDYFWLRQRIPIFVYFFYIYFKNPDNPALNSLTKIFISLTGLMTIFFTVSYFLKIPFEKLISLSWHYPGIIVWGLFFVIYYLIILKKNYSGLTAFALSVIATTGGGWLYEVPFNSKMAFVISLNTIFLLDGQILCLLLLGYELKKRGFQPKRSIYATFCIYVIFSWVCYKNFRGLTQGIRILTGNQHLFSWIYRIPTCLFLLSLTAGISARAHNRKSI